MNNNQNRNSNTNFQKQQKSNNPLMNETIPKRIVLIDENSNNLGELSKEEALQMATDKQLDVVVISPNAKVPIAKLMDYGRFLYEQKRKKRESKKKQTVIKVKEINVKPTIGQHDLSWRANNAKDWLDDGFHVKFSVKAFNRLITREDIINNLFDSFIKLVGEHGEIEKKFVRTAANTYEATIVPNKNYKPKKD
ncbi:translation initiation factor IF-3 [Mycoplasmoides pirum]|uniref:translation initiation factor IF-3 n=1 Tax=Mycoplasmoides pirum TaxID=2122 RepID=UPI000486F39C|nr:translation initiation factor IF-3 [Mycoplasmoides pirum]